MATNRAIGRALATSVACWRQEHIRQQISELAGRHGPRLAGLGSSAAFHGIGPYVHEAVAHEPGVPEPDRKAVKALRGGTALVHLRTMADLSHVRKAFDTASIPWLVVKGPVLAASHGGPTHRSYADLDVVVAGEALGDALRVLEKSGCEVMDRNWTLIRDEMKGEVHLRLPSGTPLDLHWHLLNDRRRREAFPISIPGLFENQRLIDVSGITVPTLGAAETLVYVALHTMLSGAHRLVWLKDLERLLATLAPAPDAVRDVARAWRAELVVACALQRVMAAIPGAQVDGALLAPLRAAPGWRFLAAGAWRLSPAERQDGGPSMGRVVARSVRHSGRSSFGEFRRRSRDRLRDRDAMRPDREGFAPDDPRSGLFPSGGSAARAAFLEEVAEAE